MHLPALNLETLAWIIVTALILTLIGALLLKWLAFRVAHRIADLAESGVTATLRPGVTRTHSKYGPPPPVIDDERRRRYLNEIDRFAWLMDRIIPLPIIGGIGFDAILGLVPVAGDFVSFGISGLLIVRAAQMGAPPELLSRLIAVQCVDLLIGVVPFVGDVADAGYHANVRSVKLIKDWMETTGMT